MTDKPGISAFPRYIPNPIFNGLPVYLKDPKNYEKVQRALLDTLAGTHSHGELETWASCLHCQIKLKNHGEMMRKLGFKSARQFYAWSKVMHLMLNKSRDPLPKYDE